MNYKNTRTTVIVVLKVNKNFTCAVAARTDNAKLMVVTSREPGTVRGTARRPHFSRAFISVTVQLLIQLFWVISVYFNVRNTLPKSGTFLLGHPV